MQSPRKLEGWKEIAGYLGVSERTARRWELTEGLPVSRHQHEERGSVFCTAHELDAWRTSRTKSTTPTPPPPTIPVSPKPRRKPWSLAFAIAILALAVFQWPYLRHWWLGPIRFENLKTVTSEPGAEAPGGWSPDNQTLAYVADRDGSFSLYLRKLGDPQGVRLPIPSGSVIGPRWSADGQRIYFIHASDQDNNHLAFWEPSSRQFGIVSRLHSHYAYGDLTLGPQLQLTPDGTHIILGDPDIPSGTPRLIAIRIADGARLPLTDGNGPREGYAAISNRGTLAFIQYKRFSKKNLCFLDSWQRTLSGGPPSVPRCIDSFPTTLTSLTWIPEERLLVAIGNIGRPAVVEYDAVANRVWPVSLPDRSSMAISTDRLGRLTYSRAQYDMNIATLDTSAPSISQAQELPSSSSHDLGPVAVGVEGDVAFLSDRVQDSYDLFLTSSAGVRRVWNAGLKRGNCVCASHDGRYVAVVGESNQAVIALVDLNSGVATKLSSVGANFGCDFDSTNEFLFFNGMVGSQHGVWKWHIARAQATLIHPGRFSQLRWTPDALFVTAATPNSNVVRIALPDGKPTELPLKVLGVPFGIVDRGVWSFDNAPAGTTLVFQDFAVNPAKRIPLDGRQTAGGSVSRDGKRLLLALTGRMQADIILGERAPWGLW
jgi:hypothetical protein